MKKKLLVALFAAALFATSVSAQIVNTWKDPSVSIQNPQSYKIIVAALINDPTVRRQVEDYMVTQYPGQATPSYTLFGDGPLNNNEEQYNQQLLNDGFDGIVMIRQTNENTSSHYIPGRMPQYYHTWNGYWHGGWSTWVNPGTPGHVQNDWTWYIQATVYSLRENKMIWSGTTQITDPHGRYPLFQDAINVLRGQMRNDGFLN